MIDTIDNVPDDKKRGVYKKWAMKRLNDPDGKHDDCFIFVLDIDHDPFAVPALNAYIDACEHEYGPLAFDLTNVLTSKGAVTKDMLNITILACLEALQKGELDAANSYLHQMIQMRGLSY